MEYILNNLDPVAFYIGPIVIRWYALAYLAGFLIGWRYCIHLVGNLPNSRPDVNDIDNYISWAVIGVILGGRLGYVLFYNLESYIFNPIEIIKLWHGGMSFHGGVLGVLIATIIFSRKHNIAILRMTDIVCAAAPIGLFFGRIANFINAELYGRYTDLPWGVVFPNAGSIPRHPSQLYEAGLEGIVIFIVLFLVIRFAKPRVGVISALFLMLYGIFRGGIEFVREPDAQIGFIIGDYITMGQLLCIPMIATGVVIILIVNSRKSSIEKDNA